MIARHVLTILAVSDLERATAFYQVAFGFCARVRTPAYVELELDGDRGLGLYQRERFSRNTGVAPSLVPPGASSATELYFRCDELEAAIEGLARAGARCLSARAAREWGDEAAYFCDPDGNVVVVARPLPSGC